MNFDISISYRLLMKSFTHNLNLPSTVMKTSMNNITFTVVFLAGIAFAVLVPFLTNILSNRSKSVWDFKNRPKPFSALPEVDQLGVDNDGSLEVALRFFDGELPKRRIADDLEAQGSLNAALEMKRLGKIDKALKLFEHAYVLSPLHPDVLNHYGEFMEHTQKDIITADQLYFQALTYSPAHSRALENRQRTAHVVEKLDLMMLQRIDRKRAEVSSIPETDPGLRRAKKEAYFQHIYHTVGIEGNTMTLSQTRSILETRMAIAGKSIIEHNEILGLDAALKYINVTLINRLGSITIEDILEIHRRVLGYVDPTESGNFRKNQVYVGGHVPPAPLEITSLMKEFITWLNSEQAARLHPVRYAALAHYKLVAIHPFSDGNGRTSRLLMNTILMQAGFPPIIILKEDRSKYYELLETANRGDIRPFVRFIAECTEQTLDLFLWATNSYSRHIPALGTPRDLSRLIIGDDIQYKWREQHSSFPSENFNDEDLWSELSGSGASEN